MAQFKINLLTSIINTTSDVVKYLETPISEFYDQFDIEQARQNYESQPNTGWSDRKHTYCYTFNESISFHINGQKELSFSMMRNIILDNELTVNPFVSKIKNGTQILLIDQYDNEYIFTVKDIKHTLKSNNLIYQYTCEDSFSYQHIRQHSGYSIENDISSEDFIGANTIDWWAHKIQKDCHISYEYLPLSVGLYQSKINNNLTTFEKYSSQNNVLKVVKPFYTKEEYPELYEKIPFSVSGSNASAALIALAEELGLMLNYREQNIRDNNGKRTNLFKRYFWLEPKHNEKTANLKYSPKVNIQSFDFSHNGAALTTVLNVDATEYDDELITLIPTIPPFFSSLFLSSGWEESKYTDGYFTSICQQQVFFCEEASSTASSFGYSLELKDTYQSGQSFYDSEFVYLCLKNTKDNTFIIPNYYNKISLFNDKKETSLFINNHYYSAKNSTMDFGIVDNEGNFTAYNDTFKPLLDELLGTTQQCYVRIKVGSIGGRPIIHTSQILLNFHRDATSEELEFAKIADLCPWLENKLIDFSYFLKQGVLSSTEYKALLNKFKNDLRIINGKLLYYSKEYYNSIHAKTKQLERIVTTLDSLGAAFTSDVVETYRTTGKIDNIDYFREAYRNYQTILTKEAVRTQIINYNDLLTEYFNKYFNAQQRFLKNIYYFRQYFNQKIQWDPEVKLCTKYFSFSKINKADIEDTNDAKATIEYNNNQYIRRYISFNKNPHLAVVDGDFAWDKNNFTTNVKIYSSDQTTEAIIVTKLNYKDFHIESSSNTNLIRCVDGEGYNTSKTYYRVMYKATLSNHNIKEWELEYNVDGYRWCRHHYDNDHVWYMSALPDSYWNDNTWPSSIEIGNQTLIKDFVPVSYKTIINDYIYKKLRLNPNNEREWQIHDTNTSRSTDNWWDDNDINRQLSMFHSTVFGNTFSKAEWNGNSFQQLIHNIWTHLTKVDGKEEADDRVNFYKSHFPITSVSYTGPNYTKKSYTFKHDGVERVYEYQPANKINQTYTDYINYLKQKFVDGTEGLSEVANPFSTSQYITRSLPIVTPEVEAQYFRRVPKTAAWVLAGAAVKLAGFWTVPPTPSSLLTTPNLYVDWATSQAVWFSDTKWETSGINTKSFDNEKFTENMNYTGYHDSENIIYTTSTSSYDDWNAIRQLRYDNEVEVCNVTIDTEAPSNQWIQSDIKYQKDKQTYYLYYQTKSVNELGQDYFNYYSKIALTYSSARNLNNGIGRNKKVTYKDGYLKFVHPNDVIDKQSKYKILVLKNSDNKNVICIDNNSFNPNHSMHLDIKNERISRILYYFIDNNCSDIDLYDIDITKTPTWKDYLNNYEYDELTHIYKIKDYNGNQFIECILFKQEDFNIVKLYNANHWNTSDKYITIQSKYRDTLYNNNTIYDKNDVAIDFNTVNDLITGFYRTKDVREAFKEVENEEIVWEDTNNQPTTKFFFKTNNGDYQRVYTIPQMIQLKNFYYIRTDNYEENTLSNVKKFTIPVYLHQETYIKTKENGSDVYVLDNSIENTFIKEAYLPLELEPGETTKTLTIEDIDGRIYSRECNFSQSEGIAIGNISNGQFWYLYRSMTNQPLLFETAAVIETELTQYWEQAYAASLYCEYFLPASWQPQIDGDVNYFNNNIIIFKKQSTSDNSEYIPVLSNKYLPEVSIYNNGKTSQLPYYQLKYRPPYDELDSNDSNNQLINENSYTPAKEVLSEHMSFLSIFKELGEDMSNYEISNYNTNLDNLVKTTYYYSTNPNSGTKWKNFLQTHSAVPYVFEDYDGLYLMTYKILKQQFENKHDSSYQKYQKMQHTEWDKIYRQYPGIVLEDSYSNENATTSYDLYVLAKNAFKDKQEPERGYNISLIDAYNSLLINTKNPKNKWAKYIGQELKIGEGILIDVDEYYDEYDDIYKTLSQYLFITDISYNLRKNSDIQVTVNTIKYQDKLIQRLVKLIK